MLDINLFRKEKGRDPDLVRNSQRSCFDSVELVDEAWRQRQFELDKIRQELNKTSKEIGKLKAKKQDATELIQSTEEIMGRLAAKETEVREAKTTLMPSSSPLATSCTNLCPSATTRSCCNS